MWVVFFFNLLKYSMVVKFSSPKEQTVSKDKVQSGSQLLAVWPGHHGLVEGETMGIRIQVLSMALMLWLIPFGQVPYHWSPASNWNKCN